jgi:hypothetical protein
MLKLLPPRLEERDGEKEVKGEDGLLEDVRPVVCARRPETRWRSGVLEGLLILMDG